MATVRARFGSSLVAATLYLAVAFVYLGIRPLTTPGSQLVGYGTDPQIFVWALGWLPHALLHGDNPFFSHAVWAPQGLNLAWHTTVPALALALSPLTLLAGPVAAYNVAAVLMPALAAWTAFLLCRHLTGGFWAPLVGGYVFGFSTYVLGQTEGHLHMTAVFPLPLIALVLLRYVEGELTAKGLVVRLAPLLALEVLVSTEVSFTLALAVLTALALGYAVAPDRRSRLRSSLVPLAVSAALAAVVAGPYLYYAVTGFRSASLHPHSVFVADLLNFAVPTHNSLASAGWAAGLAGHFPGNDSERDAYLGLPVLVILALFAWGRRRTPGGRFLLACLGVAGLASLGGHLFVEGHRLIPLPWALVGGLPAFDNVLPSRLAVYVSLAAAVMVALWTAASRHTLLRYGLPALGVLALAPNPSAGSWATTYAMPPFFTSSAYRHCVGTDGTVLPLPVGSTGEAILWQAVDGFRFEMAGGDLGLGPPASYDDSKAATLIAQDSGLSAAQSGLLARLIRDKHVSSAIVDEAQRNRWSAALDRLAPSRDVGGVRLYRFTGPVEGCG